MRQHPGKPALAWTHGVLLQLNHQNIYHHRCYFLSCGLIDFIGDPNQPLFDIVRKGGTGLAGMMLSENEISGQTGFDLRTTRKHLAKLNGYWMCRQPVELRKPKPIFLRDSGDELLAANRTKVPMLLFLACERDVPLAVFVAYCIRWLNGTRDKFHRSWLAIAKDTGLSWDCVKDAANKAHKLGLIEVSFAQQSDHWFWAGERLLAALQAAQPAYEKYLARRKQFNVPTDKVPARRDATTERGGQTVASRMQTLLNGGLDDKRKLAFRERCLRGDPSWIQILCNLRRYEVHFLETGEKMTRRKRTAA